MLVEIMASSGMLLKKDGDILGARSKNTDPNLRGLFVFFFVCLLLVLVFVVILLCPYNAAVYRPKHSTHI